MDEHRQKEVEALQAVLHVYNAIEKIHNNGLISSEYRDNALKQLNDASHVKIKEAIKALGG